MGRTHLKAKPVSLLRENGQGRGVQDQEAVPLLLSVVRGQRGVSEDRQQGPGPHWPPPPPPCPPPTCDGRCCSLTLEAQMALPTAGRPHAVRSWVSLCCRPQGSSSSGAPWESGVRAGRQGAWAGGGVRGSSTDLWGRRVAALGPSQESHLLFQVVEPETQLGGAGADHQKGGGQRACGRSSREARLAAHRRGPCPGPPQTPGLQLGGA